jgi:hypothetical protein
MMTSKVTGSDLMAQKPRACDVEKVEALWNMFHSTTQFLMALRATLVERELTNEAAVLDRALPSLSKIEAAELNELCDDLAEAAQTRRNNQEFWSDSCWKDPALKQNPPSPNGETEVEKAAETQRSALYRPIQCHSTLHLWINKP